MTRIYAIDDDLVFLTALEGILEEYTFECDHEGEEAIRKMRDFKPDMIFLDLQMPEISGYELCQAIRDDDQLKDTPILFISSSNDLGDKVKCLEAGADDFLTKPIEAELLRAKARLLSHSQMIVKTMREQQQSAQQVAMEAMRGSSELGQAMQFIERCQNIESEQQLAQSLIEVCNSFQLKAVVGIQLNHGWLFSKNEGMASPIEQEVMHSAHNQGRFIDFGARTQINTANVALLIKNMPVDDPERYGRIKDVLPPVLSSLNVRITRLMETQAILEQTEHIARSIEAVQPSLSQLSGRIGELTRANKHTISDLLADMSIRLPSMGMEDDQEEFILFALEQTSDMADDLRKEGELIKEKLDTVNKVMVGLLDRQASIAQIVQEKLDSTSPDTNDDSFNSDIDLF